MQITYQVLTDGCTVQPRSVPHRPLQLESIPAHSEALSLLDRPRGWNQVCKRINTFRTPCSSALSSLHAGLTPEGPLLPWAHFSPLGTNAAPCSQDHITWPEVSKEALAPCWLEMRGARQTTFHPTLLWLATWQGSPDTHNSVRSSTCPLAGKLGGLGSL